LRRTIGSGYAQQSLEAVPSRHPANLVEANDLPFVVERRSHLCIVLPGQLQAKYYERTRRNSSLFLRSPFDPSVAVSLGSRCIVWQLAARHLDQRGTEMNKDQVKGGLEKAKGSVKETVGKAVGNERLQAEGAADKTAGAVQKKVGDVKDALKTVTKKP